MTSPIFEAGATRFASPGPVGRPSAVERILRPFEEFAAIEASGGIVLLGGMLVALILANSPLASAYASLWSAEFGVSSQWLHLARPLSFWVNDGLMTIFFLVMGLEIKRELLAGQLASPRRAALPIAAALGGMVVPAVLYLATTLGTAATRGWGIPMATDIAFTIGLMALLGAKVSLGLKVFVTALAIADDIGAVLVIAVFYSHSLEWLQLAAAGGILSLLTVANWAGIRSPLFYGLVGLALWVAFLESGIHTTIAGVLLAATIPARARIDFREFLVRAEGLLARLGDAPESRPGDLASPDQMGALHSLEDACERAATPLQRIEHALHPWVTFVIMPLFALCNAGISFAAIAGGLGSPRVTIGVVLGLLFGKPVGIVLFSWLAVRVGLAAMPQRVTLAQLQGAGFLCGVGFTMSLFVANLAFGELETLASAKLGILVGSALAALVGSALLARGKRGLVKEPVPGSDREDSRI